MGFKFIPCFYHILKQNVTVSARNQFNYNFQIIDELDKPALTTEIIQSLSLYWRIWSWRAAAYFLTQIVEDSYDGDHNYYQNNYQIPTTKQRVFGFGPGLAYFLQGGILFEGKVFWNWR